jgi:hypothetical protein
MPTQLLRRANAARRTGLRELGTSLLLGRPNISAARLVLSKDVMMRQRVAKELETILTAALRFLSISMHREPRYHGDIGIDGMTNWHALCLEDAIVVVDLLLGLGRIDKGEG